DRDNPDGISKGLFKPGDTGRAQFKVDGRGVALYLPATDDLVPPVTLQLLIDDVIGGPECFQSIFPAGAVRRQNERKFNARLP
ncbi:MAG: hypothetical protein V3S33_08080, partial [Gammaproteobacteria bacterium]